jgi:penicillin-binding protein 1A
MKSYGLKVETSAKTGTTNDNTDAWFVAYTPELLCGNWVGCDENWIHFPSSSGAGYGGAAALPMIGTFLKDVYANKKLPYDPEAKFVKPAIDKNDIFYDYIENISARPVGDAIGEVNVGAGTEEQYLEEMYNEDIYEEDAEDAAAKQKQIKDSLANKAKMDSAQLKAKPKAEMLPPDEPKKTKKELRKEARQQRRDNNLP